MRPRVHTYSQLSYLFQDTQNVSILDRNVKKQEDTRNFTEFRVRMIDVLSAVFKTGLQIR